MFESEVDSLFAYVAMKEAPELNPAQAFRGDVKGLADAAGRGVDGCGVEEETSAGETVVPYGQGGIEMAGIDERAAIKAA